MGRFACLLAAAVFGAPLAAGGGAIAAGGVGVRQATLSAARSSASSAAAPESESAAQSLAASLLAELALPAGATASPLEPSGDGGYLAHPGEGPPATPNAVDEHAWWTVPEAPAGVREYIAAHLHGGSTAVHWGAATTYGVTDDEFTMVSQLQLTGTAGAGELVVSVVQLADGSTGLRADAQVVWLTPRPASEVIPPGAHILWVSVASSIPRNQPRQRPLRIVSRRRIVAIVALLNALPAFQPGLRSCPVDFGIRVELRLYARRGVAPLAIAEVDPGGCGGVALAIHGASGPALEGGGPLVGKIDGVLGTKLDVSPPRRP